MTASSHKVASSQKVWAEVPPVPLPRPTSGRMGGQSRETAQVHYLIHGKTRFRKSPPPPAPQGLPPGDQHRFPQVSRTGNEAHPFCRHCQNSVLVSRLLFLFYLPAWMILSLVFLFNPLHKTGTMEILHRKTSSQALKDSRFSPGPSPSEHGALPTAMCHMWSRRHRAWGWSIS